MCAAGIFSLEYGEISLFLKLTNLFFIGIWFVLNSLDLKRKDYKYTKIKLLLFIFIFICLTFEYILDFKFLSNIPLNEAVECCSVIFETSSISSKIPFGLVNSSLILIFYILFVLIVILNIQKKSILLLFFNILFVYISYFAVTYFFQLIYMNFQHINVHFVCFNLSIILQDILYGRHFFQDFFSQFVQQFFIEIIVQIFISFINYL